MIHMRQQLGLTQAELARVLKVAPSSVGRWESWNPPTGSALEMLGRFARNRGLDASVFVRALEESVVPVSFEVSSWEEAHHVHAFLETLRSPDFAAYRARVLRALAPVLKATDGYVAEGKRRMREGDRVIRQMFTGDVEEAQKEMQQAAELWAKRFGDVKKEKK